MTLHEYVSSKKRGEISRLAKVCGLAYGTVLAIASRRKAASFATAKKLSEATDGAVSIVELCEQAKVKGGVPIIRVKQDKAAA